MRGLVSRSPAARSRGRSNGRRRRWRGQNRASRRRSSGDCAGTGPRVASRPHVSDLRGNTRRLGRRRGHGGAGVCLRTAEDRKHLVSHQPSCRRRVRAVRETRRRRSQRVSPRQLCHRAGSARSRLDARRPAVWRDAAHVPAAADSPRRTRRSGVVVGTAASDAEPLESAVGEPHRLAVVHRVAGGLRPGRGRRGGSADGDADVRERGVRSARGHRGAWDDFTQGRKTRDAVVKHLQRLSTLTMVVAAAGLVLVGCGAAPGQPRADSIEPAPNEVVAFEALYAGNCAGCHGANGRGGAAIALANPVYLAIVDQRSMRATIADGVSDTSMPAFAQRAGGMLTDKQIDVLVDGIRSRWSDPAPLAEANPPSYAATSAGDIQRGAAAYQTFCQSCHGADGRGGPKGSAITNDSFLALVSDQALRTIVIAGRPELGAPDWRGYLAGHPMSDQEVTDVVSWLASHRAAAPGQPYVSAER